ncbi:MAG: glycoside hydrolase family 3 C-terminal domain-containing protein [Muribaculaceae bacterium]|nr:glycoside hydrolase family 3 C-terminal domain-containing protein [Muribaculaceae bacterium]
MKRLHIALAAAMMLAGAIAHSASAQLSEADIPRILKSLSTEQKARLLVGTSASTDAPSHFTSGAAGWTFAIPSEGIPGLNLADGPVGPRINPMPWISTRVVYDESGLPHDEVVEGEAPADARPQWCTAFPSTTALAATFDREAAAAQGEVMGKECAAYGVDVLLTPGINMMRNPLCGRNFEYYSEDPLLAGALAAELIKGVQAQGVGTSLKHFVANTQQTGKKVNDPVMSQRALREIYLPAFERVVREAKPWTVMTSYNKIAGEYTQTNKELLLDLLRKEWGFDGTVVTDWTVYRPTADLLNARTGLIMPGSEKIVQEILACVADGSVSGAALDSCVADVLRLAARSLSAKGWKPSVPDLEANAAVSRLLGAEAMVLLKNNDSLLPLKEGTKVALFGASAYQSIAGGTGSSNVNKRYVVDIDRGLEDAGYNVDSELAGLYRSYCEQQARLNDSHPNCPEWQKVSYHRPVIDEMDLAKANTMIESRAAANEAAVVVIGRMSGEVGDRKVGNDFNLTAAEQTMVRKVCSAFHAKGKPVVVVLNVCGTMETASWSAAPDAIVVAWMPGQECGYAVADVLSGKVNPSGRLPMTWPVHYADMPSAGNFPSPGQTEGRNFDYTFYEEDIWMGYRWFDTTGRRVAYPFGYGLSYTDFDYSDAKVSRKGDRTTVTVTVTNTGRHPGREVVQLYVSAPEGGLAKPKAELRGFTKTRELAPGESQRVSITVTDRELASFNDKASQWETAAGTYQARLGRSVGDYIVSLPFNVKKASVRKVADILAPVEKARTMRMREVVPSPTEDMSWHEASDFRLLGRCYPDSLPIYTRIPDFLHDGTRDALFSLGRHSTGMAVRFRTDSPRIALDWKNRYGGAMAHMAALGSRGADLYYLNDEGQWRFLAPAIPYGDPATTTLIIENMEPKMREYMLHLPLYDGLEYCRIGVAPDAVIEAPAVDSPRAAVKPVVIYGSSIAHGATASRPGMAANNILRRELNTDIINLGFSANAHLDYEIARMMADVDASVYVLDFVPNALVWEINEKTEPFVKILRERRPDVPLVFIEDPYFTHSQTDTKIKATIDAKNAAIKAMYERLVAEGLDNTYYISADKIVPADGDGSSDSIHFTDRGFRSYCDALLPVLRKILDK